MIGGKFSDFSVIFLIKNFDDRNGLKRLNFFNRLDLKSFVPIPIEKRALTVAAPYHAPPSGRLMGTFPTIKSIETSPQ